MGNLLGSPITEKETHSGTTPGSTENGNVDLPYGVSSMQGWRIHMEDAHICQPFLFAEEPRDGGGGKTGSEGEKNAVMTDASANNSSSSGAEDGKEKAASSNSPAPSDEADDDVDDAQKNNPSTSSSSSSPVKQSSTLSSSAATSSSSSSPDQNWIRIPIPGHSLYAVFDGHGGTFAAEYAGLNMCRVLSRQARFVEYARHCQKMAASAASSASASSGMTDDERQLARRAGLDLLEEALRDAFVAIDREIMMQIKGLDVVDANAPYGDDFDDHHSHGEIHAQSEDDDGEEKRGEGSVLSSDDDDDVMADLNVTVERNADPTNPDILPPKSSSSADAKYPGPARPPEYEDSGTTAIVVVLTPHSIVCANSGDSRAVYAKNSARVVPLSYDHKPDDEDEERRIREAGGYVSGGRVEGDLAVSRGLGDFRFKDEETVMLGVDGSGGGNGNDGSGGGKKSSSGTDENSGEDEDDSSPKSTPRRPDDQKVSPVPDIVVQSRNPEQDEFLVVACDGIWDVQTNLECVKMVSEMFAEGESNIGLICEEGLDICLRRGSKDNMTILVVKLEAQEIGKGGGVLARRELREAEAKAARDREDSGNESDKRKRDEFFSGSPGYS